MSFADEHAATKKKETESKYPTRKKSEKKSNIPQTYSFFPSRRTSKSNWSVFHYYASMNIRRSLMDGIFMFEGRSMLEFKITYIALMRTSIVRHHQKFNPFIDVSPMPDWETIRIILIGFFFSCFLYFNNKNIVKEGALRVSSSMEGKHFTLFRKRETNICLITFTTNPTRGKKKKKIVNHKFDQNLQLLICNNTWYRNDAIVNTVWVNKGEV